MLKDQLILIIERAWQERANDIIFAKEAIDYVLDALDQGEIRVAEKGADKWEVNEWIKKAILLSFKLYQSEMLENNCYDKLPLKFSKWEASDFANYAIRAVPGSVVRKSAYIGRNVVLMPSFVNIGAYVGDGSLIDTWSTIGSCAQVGKNCHISGGVGIGGVLEPVQASPVIIEDNCFIGARSEVAEGVVIGEGSVLAMGVFLGQSTKIYNRLTKEITYGYVPPYSVVVPGSLLSEDGSHNLYAAVIVKQVDQQTRNKTSINELLRL
jgi:2,3,4,5-tetrahydropyridine-2-carboxylate N-succinyltransferase